VSDIVDAIDVWENPPEPQATDNADLERLKKAADS
jgi:hypothetical protein